MGWFSIDRKIQDHWTWKEKPFSKGQAWIDLILLANHNDKKFPFGNEVVFVKRGSFITSELKLMERWGWGKSKTRSFLKMLENEDMIIKKSDRKRTAITIVKYDDYQDNKTNNKPSSDHKQTVVRPSSDTNNKDNNINKDNKKDIAPSAENDPIDYSNVERKWD